MKMSFKSFATEPVVLILLSSPCGVMIDASLQAAGIGLTSPSRCKSLIRTKGKWH